MVRYEARGGAVTASGALKLDAHAVLWSASESDRAGKPLLVMMHGYGSHEGDLFGLSPYLPLNTVVASLRAPIPEGGGYAWFPRESAVGANPAGRPHPEIVDAAALAVLNWLDAQPAAPAVGLLGFSQGAAMALQLLRHAPGRFACAVQLSGFVASGAAPGDAELAQLRPPVFWGRGTDDDVIPADAIARTADWLPAHANADTRIYEGLAHAVSQQELTDVAAFLGTHLN
ncbi:phospholipase [Leifsonia sp. Root112D2]|nr:phospholipase [Leifsonia sp. Root112D2]